MGRRGGVIAKIVAFTRDFGKLVQCKGTREFGIR